MAHVSSRTTGCLFCGNEHGRFESTEHIVALALGNTVESGLVDADLVIPAGEVCDKCNRRRLSLRDKALVEWPPVSVFRSLGRVANRRGRRVDAVVDTRWRLEFDADDPCVFRLCAIASTGPGSGRDEVARALCKVAVETRWLDDPEDARSERWDPVAAAAIGGPLPSGLVMGLSVPTDCQDINLAPGSRVLVDRSARELRMVCQLWAVGLRLLLLINSSAPWIPKTAWWRVDAQTGSLQGPGSMWASFNCRAETARRLTAESAKPASRRSSRLPTHDATARLYLL